MTCPHTNGPSPCTSQTLLLACSLAAGAWLNELEGTPYDDDANGAAIEYVGEVKRDVGEVVADPSVIGCCPKARRKPGETYYAEETVCEVHGERTRGSV